MISPTSCPQCQSENIYPDGNLWICPECSHEWSAFESADSNTEAGSSTASDAILDATGKPLSNGDSVTVIKDLKIKGSSSVVKGGTKVKNIRLVDGHDGHNIACKIDGLGSMNLKSEFVKKV